MKQGLRLEYDGYFWYRKLQLIADSEDFDLVICKTPRVPESVMVARPHRSEPIEDKNKVPRKFNHACQPNSRISTVCFTFAACRHDATRLLRDHPAV